MSWGGFTSSGSVYEYRVRAYCDSRPGGIPIHSDEAVLFLTFAGSGISGRPRHPPPTAKKETRQKGGALVDGFLLPAVGLEPTRPRGQQILSLPCMPFHHAGAVLFVLWGCAGRQGDGASWGRCFSLKKRFDNNCKQW